MSHYFHTPSGEEHRRQITVSLWDTDVDMSTANGVFSADRLDLGTSVLLRSVNPRRTSATLLDLGCGYGPITVALAMAAPQASILAVDVNERAIALARENADRLGFAHRVTVSHPDDVDPQQRFDEIWSNPPIRIGKAALHELLQTWLPRVKPGGIAHLVVGKNLGADSLHTWMLAQGWDVTRTASAKGFRVLSVSPGS